MFSRLLSLCVPILLAPPCTLGQHIELPTKIPPWATIHIELASGEQHVRSVQEGIVVSIPRDMDLTFTCDSSKEFADLIQNVSWSGPVLPQKDGSARLSIYAPGTFTVQVTAQMTLDPSRHVNTPEYTKSIHINVLPVRSEDVRTHILYPSEKATPPVDVNGDRLVNDQDLDAFWEYYGLEAQEAGFNAIADWDGDQRVDLRDLASFVQAFEAWDGQGQRATYGNGLIHPISRLQNPQYSFQVPDALFSARTEPRGLEQWITWSVADSPFSRGPRAQRSFERAGDYVVSASVFGTPGSRDQRILQVYKTEITNFRTAADFLIDGESYTFVARTDPPGFEDYILWYPSTLYGTVAPAFGRGATFTVRFRDTWGPHPYDDSLGHFQWLGVQADNAYYNQDSKCPTNFPQAEVYALDVEIDATMTIGATQSTVVLFGSSHESRANPVFDPEACIWHIDFSQQSLSLIGQWNLQSVVGRDSVGLSSSGTVYQASSGQDYPAPTTMELNLVLNTMVDSEWMTLHTASPLQLSGSANAIPPVGATLTSSNTVSLLDSLATPRGVLENLNWFVLEQQAKEPCRKLQAAVDKKGNCPAGYTKKTLTVTCNGTATPADVCVKCQVVNCTAPKSCAINIVTVQWAEGYTYQRATCDCE